MLALPVFLLIWSCALFPSAFAMRFDMQAVETKCFSEDLSAKSLVLVKYHVIESENTPNISVRVSSPHGNTLHHQERVTQGEFSFTANEAGTHMACFWIPYGGRDAKASIELDWRTGVAAKDWASIAKREKIEGMELELRKLEDSVQAIHDEMLYLRQREEEMRKVNETTNSRLAWFSIASLFICLMVAGLQLWHLKTFFEKKKLI
ncbi:hypothetical protein GOP47_0015791 [Adiantum capillus-veneris]|uniref:GOLD domain-containing protein n=1 Tax=Adiantum capillus-veneris TaxID=13818 RepID=A0A9D4ZDJ3_ADICA|nr:hypothetical protein GOP47_0015791 [Adiantum capillus-veneris]